MEELCAFARGCLEGVRGPADLGRAFVVPGAEAPAGSSESTAAVAELDALTRAWAAESVRQGRAGGELRPGPDPHAFAFAFVGLLKGLVVQAATAPEAFGVTAASAEAGRWIRPALGAGWTAARAVPRDRNGPFLRRPTIRRSSRFGREVVGNAFKLPLINGGFPPLRELLCGLRAVGPTRS
ncbi:TetR family transcriptional regulator C-terminal domain-containing protein [Kitasatospora sp. NPDC094028]